jgi:protein SCO1/2
MSGRSAVAARARGRRVAALVLAVLVLVASGWPGEAQHAGHPERPAGVRLQPLFDLTTHGGGRLVPQDLRGRPFAVFFGFTNCPDVCPTTLLEMSNLLVDLGPDGDRLRIFFITVDPERDTVEHLFRYLASFDRRITALTGSPVEIAAVAHAFNAFYERVETKGGDYTMNHSTKVFVMDRYGLLAGTFDTTTAPAGQRDLLHRVLRQ